MNNIIFSTNLFPAVMRRLAGDPRTRLGPDVEIHVGVVQLGTAMPSCLIRFCHTNDGAHHHVHCDIDGAMPLAVVAAAAIVVHAIALASDRTNWQNAMLPTALPIALEDCSLVIAAYDASLGDTAALARVMAMEWMKLTIASGREVPAATAPTKDMLN